MLTTEQAETKVRDYWASPVGTELGEAAKFARMHTMLCHELTKNQWHKLYKRLGGKFTKKEWKLCGSDGPPVFLPLLKLIDRRPRLKIKSPEPDKENNARHRVGRR